MKYINKEEHMVLPETYSECIHDTDSNCNNCVMWGIVENYCEYKQMLFKYFNEMNNE